MKTSDLISASRLDVQIRDDCVYQAVYVRGHLSTATWRRVQDISSSVSGNVHLQECRIGKRQQLRTVKQLQKRRGRNLIDYGRELEAAALFSLAKYEESFVQSFGWFESANHVFLTMEYMPLGALSRHMGQRFPERDARSIIRQVLVALKYMHERDLIHRDLTPANIFVCEPGPNWWVKVGEFGISKRALDGDSTLQASVCASQYVAPEIAIGEDQAYTRAADIWSVGMLAFSLLTTEEALFSPRELHKYYIDAESLSAADWARHGIKEEAGECLSQVLASAPARRPSATECLQHEWLAEDPATTHSQGSGPSYPQSNLGAGSRSAKLTAMDLHEPHPDYRWSAPVESHSFYDDFNNGPIEPQLQGTEEKYTRLKSIPADSLEKRPLLQSRHGQQSYNSAAARWLQNPGQNVSVHGVYQYGDAPLQANNGPMAMSLQMTADGQISGSANDASGKSDIRGRIDARAGTVQFVKAYGVRNFWAKWEYDGRLETSGRWVKGVWRPVGRPDSENRGRFVLWLEVDAPSMSDRLREAKRILASADAFHD